MKDVKQRVNVIMHLDTGKAERLHRFLENTGRRRGMASLVEVLLMREVENWETSLSTPDQASELRKMMGGEL